MLLLLRFISKIHRHTFTPSLDKMNTNNTCTSGVSLELQLVIGEFKLAQA